MVSVCTVPARGGRSCEHFGGYKTINRIPFTLLIWPERRILGRGRGCEKVTPGGDVRYLLLSNVVYWDQ